MNIDGATASMHLNATPMHSNRNALHALNKSISSAPNMPSWVCASVRWHGLTRRAHLWDAENWIAGDYMENRATIEWSVEQAGFKFVSNPAYSARSEFAELGYQSNGAFFS